MPKLEGRVIAIAGAGGGLGPVVAEALAREGATVALPIARGRARRARRAARAPRGADGRPVVDLLDEDAARAWCDRLDERFGHVDGLLHLVGGWRGGEPIDTAPLDDYDFLHDLLVRTVQHTSAPSTAR